MYKIKQYSLDKALQANIQIQPSQTGNFKIDCFDQKGNFLASIGDKRYSDFPTFMEEKGEAFALKKRDLYWKRHQNDSKIRGQLAKLILW